MFWSAEGKPIPIQEFLQNLFDDLPQFFENEEQLRSIWSDPTTREALLINLNDLGYDSEKLEDMKALIDAKDSDVYDVLAFVAYASEAMSRKERVSKAGKPIRDIFTDDKQREFIDFILSHYVRDGVSQLSRTNMKSLLELKYGSISDAAETLGSIPIISNAFIGCQKYLYE
jgi:type I restriction enzyme R subunit